MAQKPLFKSGKKKPSKAPAANKHGKIQKVQKGTIQKAAKKPAARKQEAERQEVSKLINRRIEEQAAASAASNGLKLTTVRPVAVEDSKKTKKQRGQPK